MAEPQFIDYQSQLNGKRMLVFDLGFSETFNSALSQTILNREPELFSEFGYGEEKKRAAPMTAIWNKYNVLTWGFEENRMLKLAIAACAKIFCAHYQMKHQPNFIQCWANVMRRGNKVGIHHHSFPYDISGLYYACEPKTDDQGQTHYIYKKNGEEQFFKLEPRAGRLAMFQSDLLHFVPEYQSDNIRITVPFDIRMKPEEGKQFVLLDEKLA